MTITESNVGTFVEQGAQNLCKTLTSSYFYAFFLLIIISVSSETLRYTARDMEIIRREARLATENTKDEVQQMKTACQGYEKLLQGLERKHDEELRIKVKIIDNSVLNTGFNITVGIETCGITSPISSSCFNPPPIVSCPLFVSRV